MRFKGCNKADISNNKLNQNSGASIYISWSDNSQIHYNTTKQNGNYGVNVNSSSESNIIYENNFIDNLGASSQAFCSEPSNIWYNSSSLKGNYWSDFSGSDYSIDGPTECIDLYPLHEMVENQTNSSSTNSSIKTISLPIFSLVFIFVPALIILYRRRRDI